MDLQRGKGGSFTTLWTGYVKTHGRKVRINFFSLRGVLIILAKSISKVYKNAPLKYSRKKPKFFGENLSRTRKCTDNCINRESTIH